MHARRQADLASVAWECLRDLAITFLYATLAGTLIVAVVASDAGPASLPRAILYAAMLPIAVGIMIAVEVAATVIAEWRGRPAA